MVNGLATFRLTVVKLYYRPDHLWSDPEALHALHELLTEVAVPLAVQPRKRGRPPGSKNKRKRKANAYMIKKEEADLKLAIKLRNNRVIITSGALFKASNN
jgi:hypothetical protein